MWQRQSLAAYFDLETDFTDKLSGGVAGRYEHYNQGVGGTRSGKISLRYQATDSFALRGTVSNGFRAPSLAQEHYESVTTLIDPGGCQAQLAAGGRNGAPGGIAACSQPGAEETGDRSLRFSRRRGPADRACRPPQPFTERSRRAVSNKGSPITPE